MKSEPSWICLFLFGGAVVLFSAPRVIAAEESVKKPSMENVMAFDRPRPGISEINAVVTELDLLGDGRARVKFAEVKKPGEPQIKPGGRSITWDYVSPGRPVPATKGMQVTVGIDTKGSVTDLFAGIKLCAYRKDSSGHLEVIAKSGNLQGQTFPPMHLRPHWIGICPAEIPVTMVWSRNFGLMFTLFAAGGGESEVENQTRDQKTIPVGNEPGFSYSPGRDGWKPVPPASSPLRIPPQQAIWAAG